MMLNNFNFAQPWWLCGLILIPLGWIWYWYCNRKANQFNKGLEKFADPQLLPHILLQAHKAKSNQSVAAIFSLLITCIIIALANPRWSYEEIDAYAPAASMVVLLDIGEQMSARDVTPSRIVRARQNLEDLLNASRGLKIGLIGFAAKPHLISPITDDVQTIKNYLPAIDTFLTNKQGNNLNAAIADAAELLAAEPGTNKTILLISDGNFADKDHSDAIAELRYNNIKIHVMAIGTAAGAPYTDPTGQMRRINGQLAISKLNQTVLQEIARQSNGVYIVANSSSSGVKTILAKAQHIEGSEHIVNGKIRQWQDRYFWLLIPAAVLMCWLLTQRALFVIAAAVIISAFTSDPAQALELSNLFKNSDNQAKQQFNLTNFAEAAEQFKDPYRKGVALYRAGDFAAAEQQFMLPQRSTVKNAALYNAGNAQMQQKKWRAAIKNYEQVLAADPNHADAKFNLELAKKMLDKDDCECNDPKSKDKGKDKNKDGAGNDRKDDDSTDNDKEDNDSKDKNSKDKDGKDNDNKDNSKSKDQEQQQNDNKNSDQQNSDQQNSESKQESKQADNQAAAAQSNPQLDAAQEARAQQWLNRVNSDIRVYLQNKFYIEDMLQGKGD